MDSDWLSLGVLMAVFQSVAGSAVVYINVQEDESGWKAFIPDSNPDRQTYSKAAYPHSTSIHLENSDVTIATHFYECRFIFQNTPTRDIGIYSRDLSVPYSPKSQYPCHVLFTKDPEKRVSSTECEQNFNIPVGILFETYGNTIDFSKTPVDFRNAKKFTVKHNHSLWFNIHADVDVRCNAVPVSYGHRFLDEIPENAPPVTQRIVPITEPKPRVNIPTTTLHPVTDNTTTNSSVILVSESTHKDSTSIAIGVALAVILVAIVIIVTIVIFIVAKRRRRDKRDFRPQERLPLNNDPNVEDTALSQGATTSLKTRLTENQANEAIDKRTSCGSQMPDVICVNGKSPGSKSPATVIGGVVTVAGSPHEYDEANARYSLSSSSAPSVAGSSTKDKDSHHYFTIDEEYVRNNPNHWAGYPIPPRSTQTPVPAPRLKKMDSPDASKEGKYSDSSSSNNYEEIDFSKRNRLGLPLKGVGAVSDTAVCGDCSLKVDSNLRSKNRAATPDGYEEPVCCEPYGYARISQIIEREDMANNGHSDNKIDMPPELPSRTIRSPSRKPELKKKPDISNPTLIKSPDTGYRKPIEGPNEPANKPLFTKSETANRSNPRSPVSLTMPKHVDRKRPRPKSTSTIARPNAKPPAPPTSPSSVASLTIPRPRIKPPEPPPKSDTDSSKTQTIVVLKTPL